MLVLCSVCTCTHTPTPLPPSYLQAQQHRSPSAFPSAHTPLHLPGIPTPICAHLIPRCSPHTPSWTQASAHLPHTHCTYVQLHICVHQSLRALTPTIPQSHLHTRSPTSLHRHMNLHAMLQTCTPLCPHVLAHRQIYKYPPICASSYT